MVGQQIRISKLGASLISKFYLSTPVTGGAITISTDGGATSKPLVDIEEVALTELDAGFYEVIADATFFTLKPSGIKFIGNAGVADVLIGKSFYSNDKTLKTGTMPNRGVFNLGLGVSVPAGYYSGGTTATGKKFAVGQQASQILSGTVVNRYGNTTGVGSRSCVS